MCAVNLYSWESIFKRKQNNMEETSHKFKGPWVTHSSWDLLLHLCKIKESYLNDVRYKSP